MSHLHLRHQNEKSRPLDSCLFALFGDSFFRSLTLFRQHARSGVGAVSCLHGRPAASPQGGGQLCMEHAHIEVRAPNTSSPQDTRGPTFMHATAVAAPCAMPSAHGSSQRLRPAEGRAGRGWRRRAAARRRRGTVRCSHSTDAREEASGTLVCEPGVVSPPQLSECRRQTRQCSTL